MDKQEFLRKMENLESPDLASETHRRQLKLTLMNTQKSATFGVFFVLTPFLSAFGMILKHNLGIEFGLFTTFPSWLVTLEERSLILTFLIRTLLLGGPLVAIMINLLAILHFQFDGQAKEVLVSIKLKWLNIAVIAFCSLIALIFLSYLLVENINHP
ncbi:hypothetical protein MJD09_06915 [bacterium]|nr:hypothetical protein [bacterium]